MASNLRLNSQILAGLAAVFSIMMTFKNPEAIATLWMLISQIQLFFLLLITRAYIPEDVQTIITGVSIALNPYELAPAFHTLTNNLKI